MSSIPFISSTEVNSILKWDLLLPAVEESLRAYSRGPEHPAGAVQPLRSTLNVEKHSGKFFIMPSYMPSQERVAIKVVGAFENNGLRNLPTVHGLVTLIDATTGRPLAIVEGRSITALRTAAASAVATKELAPENSKVVAIIGAGVQAKSHACAMNFLLKPQEIRVISRGESAKELAKDLQIQGIPAVAVDSIEEAVRGAHVINTCTRSSDPLIAKEWLLKGAHINVVGACGPNQREVDPSIMTSHFVFADSIEGAFTESGDIMQSGIKEVKEIGVYLEEGSLPNLREHSTLFKNLGIGVEDLVAANLVFEQWNKRT